MPWDPRAPIWQDDRQERDIGVAPPPRAPRPAVESPLPPSEPGREELAAAVEPAPLGAAGTVASASRRRPPPAPERDDLPGFQRGTKRAISMWVARDVLALINDAARESASSPVTRTKADVVMTAVRATWRDIVAQYAPEPTSDDELFGAPTPRRRQNGLIDPKQLVLHVSVSEAAGLADVRARTQLSIGGIISEAVRRYYQRPGPDNATEGG